ncbi:plastidic glucose transporter 4 [Pyricularia oryzae 70-15]|uniref:Plastidic glucose transporter 4 n=3 Tax=Pyricularia oryzae TaxID=318829 RepID=G4N947_PYRO7|nr:plastidic glucose transporter 4 [Pyricularia oryzae 70-15]EHA50291.1 plastidic glucose transporter 4 [Pyricularia oryzae 70-15]ELQ35124.1 galactose-proton symporter [Pyricularia oryzae Y34]KAI7926704.1 plastidic glucose transporter 4 [Pyricularia oryzae]KAI7928868.1 plastidic glucose transporter 4 [Pyricularia oryzae]
MPPPRVDDEAPMPPEDNGIDSSGPRRSSSGSTAATYNNAEKSGAISGQGGVVSNQIAGQQKATVGALLKNPLAGMTDAQIIADADRFVEEKGLTEHREAFRKGAMLARVQNNDTAFEQLDIITEQEKETLRKEVKNRWHQPFMLYFLCSLCAGSAIVQGMDQTAVNGAQEFYYETFNITDDLMRGLLNGAPYLCSALIGCWTNPILNKWTGRRGTIFISCFVSTVTGFWMAAADTWYNLLIARFALGFAVGAKSSTTPVYSAECTPKAIRGALTMQWQMWTAFGIMLGFVASVAFANTDFLGENTQWRWMLASTSIPPFLVMIQVYFCPESPRWYMERGEFTKAYSSVRRLRYLECQAARDMYYAFKLLEIEQAQREGRNLLKEFFTVRRNRRAAQSSWFVMFMQQFCGVNVIAYYSTAIFQNAGFSRNAALLTSLGGGAINFLFAIPAIYTIDTFGRRNLLLVTFPLMAIMLFFTGFSFFIPEDNPARLGCIATGIYLFMMVYSPGEGPVPFTYSAEAFPLHIRDIGMSSATAITWGFNFIISFSWPALETAFGPTGAFCWYAAWNIFGWIFAYFLLPETKNLTLEELDMVFGVSNRDHAKYYTDKLPWYLKKHILRKDVDSFPPLYQLAEDEDLADPPIAAKVDDRVDAKQTQPVMSPRLGVEHAEEPSIPGDDKTVR